MHYRQRRKRFVLNAAETVLITRNLKIIRIKTKHTVLERGNRNPKVLRNAFFNVKMFSVFYKEDIINMCWIFLAESCFTVG